MKYLNYYFDFDVLFSFQYGNAAIQAVVQHDHVHILPYLLGQFFQSVLYEIHLWWVKACFGKTVPVNRVKDAHDHFVPLYDSQHSHTEKRTKETIKCHSHLMALAYHLSIFRYEISHNKAVLC
jgi:hypothetical protein